MIIDRGSIQVDVGDVKEILKMKFCVQNWRKTFNDPARQQYWARLDEEFDILVTLEQNKKTAKVQMSSKRRHFSKNSRSSKIDLSYKVNLSVYKTTY